MFPTNISIKELAQKFREDFKSVCDEIKKVIVGQEDIVENVVISLFVGGHVLLEGVPGLGKTMLVKTMSKTLDLPFSRIQFTPDLMPADIIGTNLIDVDEKGKRYFRFQPGPIFSHLILADEINRATPKTQSALLECMQEKSITVAGVTARLEEPFFVMATQNPLEMEGTYPLPEAQMDRFLFKLLVPYPGLENPEKNLTKESLEKTLVPLEEILRRTTENTIIEPKKVLDRERILSYNKLFQSVRTDVVRKYVCRLVLATHPESAYATPMVKKYVRYGASPRGAQALILSGKIKALLNSEENQPEENAARYNVCFEDIKNFILPALRHRIILNFVGESERITSDSILSELERTVKDYDLP